MVEFSSNVMVRDCGFWGRMLSRLQRDTHAFARPMRLCRIQPGLFLGGACQKSHAGVCGPRTHTPALAVYGRDHSGGIKNTTP